MTSVVSFAHSYGLIGTPPPAYLTVGDLGVGRVAVAPAIDTATALGDTIHLAATITDKRGSALVGALLSWSSDEPNIASVDDKGQVLARSPGTATIVAAAGDHLGRARIVVRPIVKHVRILADSMITMGEGEQHRFRVRVTDARDFVVADERVVWHATDSLVATVDTLGTITARGIGRTTLTATADGVSDRATLTIVPVPASFTLVSDSALSAAAGAPIPRPLVVHVASRRGQSAFGATVHFATDGGQGRVEPAAVRADADGNAKVRWTLGGFPGRQHLIIAVDGVDSTLTVTAEAEPVAANTRYSLVGREMTGRVGEQLPQPVVVRLADTLDRPLADLPVAWSPEDGGIVTAIDARTDSLGMARATWTLGPKTGRQRVRVQVGSARAVPPFHITATATAGPAASATIVSGNAQTARVGASLDKPIRVRVVDAAGNPVSGARVMVLAASGTTPDTLVATDSTGTIAIHWKLGRIAGTQQMLARPEGVARALTLTAIARPRTAANIEFVSAPDTGMAGRTFRKPILVLVRDEYGNPVSDAQVLFTVRSGRVSSRTVVTDASGRASTKWTLGRTRGEQSLTAAVPKTDARAVLTVEAKAATTK
ncbi:MAG TPA: Ig-like domain-containing protein [Gemmatimonadaceae bacterium]|nr:Ig-like domain-containing protein [Gemmatimonadaceae bacterium]